MLVLLFPTQFDVDLINTMLVSLRCLYISLFGGWGLSNRFGVYAKRSIFPSFAIAHFQNAGCFFPLWASLLCLTRVKEDGGVVFSPLSPCCVDCSLLCWLAICLQAALPLCHVHLSAYFILFIELIERFTWEHFLTVIKSILIANKRKTPTKQKTKTKKKKDKRNGNVSSP